MRNMGRYFAYFGNWEIPARADKGGISVFEYDSACGDLSFIETVMENINAGNLCVDEQRRILYAADERDHLPGRRDGGGSVYTMKIDPASGKLCQIGCSPSYGVYPSYICSLRDEDLILVTNHSGMGGITIVRQGIDGYCLGIIYDDSNVVLFERRDDGTPGKVCDVKTHDGSSIKPMQEHAHPHCVVASPDQSLFLVCDKGNDQIYLYSLDPKTRTLRQESTLFSDIPGSAPRYGVFHPSLGVFYHNNELEPDVCVVSYNGSGRMELLQRCSLLPDDYVPVPAASVYEVPAPSDIVISSDGNYLYCTLRNLDRIVVFSVDHRTGLLTCLQNTSCGGKNPRSIRIDPDGRFALVTNLDSAEIAVFRVEENGTLSDTGKRFSAPHPANIAFCRIDRNTD